MNYGVIYRAALGSILAGRWCAWQFHYGIPVIYPAFSQASALLKRFPWLRELEGKVVPERILMPYLIANVELISQRPYAQLLPLLTRLSQAVSFQQLVGSTSRAIVGSRVVRLKRIRPLQT